MKTNENQNRNKQNNQTAKISLKVLMLQAIHVPVIDGNYF